MTTTSIRYRLPALLACGLALAAGCSNGKAKEKESAEADTAVPVACEGSSGMRNISFDID